MLHRQSALAALFFALSAAATAQTATTFGYQGRLDDAGLPANGSYDLEFQLFSDAGGTTSVSGPVDKLAQPVARGLFSTTLDFGDVFDGSARYLRVGVRPGSTGGAFTFLAPLQLLTAEPEAIRARIKPLLLNGGTDQSLANGDFIGMGSSSATFIRNSYVAGANGTLANLSFTIRQSTPVLNLTATVYVNNLATPLQVVIANGATTTFGVSAPGVQQPVIAGDLISIRFINRETRSKMIKQDPNSVELIQPFLIGRDVRRYSINIGKQYLILIPKGWTNANIKKGANPWNWLKSNYPAIAGHLAPFEDAAKLRSDQGDYWWELRACEYYDIFQSQRIMYLVFQVNPAFTFVTDEIYANNAVWIIPGADKVLLALLNSRLGWFQISKYCTQIQGGYQLIFKYLGKISIKEPNKKNKHDSEIRESISERVDKMLELTRCVGASANSGEQERLQRQIDATDRQIDALVYELYGLTDEEIKIVERAS